MSAIVTRESDLERWTTLYNQWIWEKRPGWLVTGAITWIVVKKSDTDIEFRQKSAQELYEHTSFK